MKTNILILSAGRRVELVEAFKTSLGNLSINGKVLCTDMSPELSSACHVADMAFSVPRVTADSYIDEIKKICIEHEIAIVVPTIDTELLLLSQYKASFKEFGTELVVSTEELMASCRDKRETAALFASLKIDQPQILNINELTFPCFCKPYDGSCSVGAFPLFSKEELTPEIIANEKNMYMELVPKTYVEYTVDCYFNKSSELRCLVPRKRLEVRAGEVSKGVTKKNFVYDYLTERLSFLKGAFGCITVQVFVNEESMEIKGLEINPRFGGGYPLSEASGASFTSYLIQEYILNQNVEFNDEWKQDLIMLRYDAKVLVDGSC